MKCPYCVSEISDAALACPQCTRDLYLFKPLLERIGGLERQMAEMQAQLSEAIAAAPTAGPAQSEPAAEPAPEPPQAALLWLAPLLLLLVSHLLITVVFDLNSVYLRIVSLLIPLPFGWLLMRREDRHLGVWAVAAFVMAAIAVLGMSGITHLVDHTPILPDDRREWKEFIEYAASVGFSLMTGMLIGRRLRRRGEPPLQLAQAPELALRLIKLVDRGQQSAEKVQDGVKKIKDIGNSIAAAGTTAAALYTGLQGFLGGHG